MFDGLNCNFRCGAGILACIVVIENNTQVIGYVFEAVTALRKVFRPRAANNSRAAQPRYIGNLEVVLLADLGHSNPVKRCVTNKNLTGQCPAQVFKNFRKGRLVDHSKFADPMNTNVDCFKMILRVDQLRITVDYYSILNLRQTYLADTFLPSICRLKVDCKKIHDLVASIRFQKVLYILPVIARQLNDCRRAA